MRVTHFLITKFNREGQPMHLICHTDRIGLGRSDSIGMSSTIATKLDDVSVFVTFTACIHH